MNVAKANSLSDFIIPVHIDHLPYGEINVLLTKLIAIPFEAGWAKGYSSSRESGKRGRSKEEAYLRTRGGDVLVAAAIQRRKRGFEDNGKVPLSNWYPIKSVPTLHLHTLQKSTVGPLEPETGLPYAHFMDGLDLVTFAPAKDLKNKLGVSISIDDFVAFFLI